MAQLLQVCAFFPKPFQYLEYTFLKLVSNFGRLLFNGHVLFFIFSGNCKTTLYIIYYLLAFLNNLFTINRKVIRLMAIVDIDHRLSLIRLSTDLLNLLHIFKEGVPNWFEYVQQIKSNPPIREGVLFANPYLTSTNKLLFVFFYLPLKRV